MLIQRLGTSLVHTYLHRSHTHTAPETGRYGCLAQALSAGVIEECLFRAIPLAGSTLLYRRFVVQSATRPDPPWWWAAATQVLQAVIFGAAHANYPAQPSYARLCELILPSFLFGHLYMR